METIPIKLMFVLLFTTSSTAIRNVLFIIVDDLRPALATFGDRIAVTPNIDAIADNGVKFSNAFAQVLSHNYILQYKE